MTTADAFLTALGKDDQDDGPPRKRKPKPADQVAAPAPVEDAVQPAPAPAALQPPAPTPGPEQPAPVPAQALPVFPPIVAPTRRPVPEPVHKTSVDLLLTLKQGLQELCDRDHRGPKAELNDALRTHLESKGITIQAWEG